MTKEEPKKECEEEPKLFTVKEWKAKRLDLEQSFTELNNRVENFLITVSANKMTRKEIEALIQQIKRLDEKLQYWIKFPHQKEIDEK